MKLNIQTTYFQWTHQCVIFIVTSGRLHAQHNIDAEQFLMYIKYRLYISLTNYIIISSSFKTNKSSLRL